MNKFQTNAFVIFLSFLFVLIIYSKAYAQEKQVLKGTIERIKVHGKLLEGNLSSDSTDRYVSVYLPASSQKIKQNDMLLFTFYTGTPMMMQNSMASVNIGWYYLQY